MNVTPCMLPLFFLGGIALSVIIGMLSSLYGKKLINYFKSIRFVHPEFRIPRLGQLALKLAIPAILLGVFIANVHLVDCKDHHPIVKIKDCNCGTFASK